MMKVKAKEVMAKVNLLVDPTPSRMSYVDNGANQTPFNTVKRDKIKRATKETRIMGISKSGKGSKRRGYLQKMQFSKSLFTTKADVKKYFEENEIEDYGAIEDGDDVWIVKSSDTPPKKVGKAMATPANADGVTAFISEVLDDTPVDTAKGGAADEDEEDDDADADDDDTDEDDDTSEDDDADEDEDGDDDEAPAKPAKKAAASRVKIVGGKTVAKAAAKGVKAKPSKKNSGGMILALPKDEVAKYDWWGSYLSGEQTLSGVMADGTYDGVPPGLETVLMATGFTLGNVIKSDDLSDDEKLAALKQVGTEMADFAFGLYNVFKTATDQTTSSTSKATRKGAAAFVESFSSSVDELASKGLSANVIKADPEDDEDDDDTVEEEVAPKPAKKAAAKAAPAVTSDPALLAIVSKLADKVDAIATDQSRSTVRRSMSDSIEDIVPDYEDAIEEEDERVETAKSDFARSLGMRI